MFTFGDLVKSPERLADLGECDALIAASGEVVVVKDKAAGVPASTMVFMHETISMMRAERAEQVDKLMDHIELGSAVVPLRRKPDSLWDNITLGRASTADIVVNDPAVSSVHAHFVLEVDDHPVSVQDVGSSNGTFLNRHQLQPHELRPLGAGDCLRFGQTVFYYVTRSLLADLVRAGAQTPPRG
jgi:predicted component of type VI protein secretion system